MSTAAPPKARVGDDLTQIIQIGRDAMQATVSQRAVQLVDGLIAILAMHDELREHGIVVRRYLGAGGDPAV